MLTATQKLKIATIKYDDLMFEVYKDVCKLYMKIKTFWTFTSSIEVYEENIRVKSLSMD